MNRAPRIIWILIALSILWLFVIFMLFYSVQKPLGASNLQAILDSLLNLSTATAIVILGTALGHRVLSGFSFSSRGEGLIFAAGSGLGIISLATLGLGMLGFLYPIAFAGLALVLAIILRRDLQKLLRTLPELLAAISLPRPLAIYLVASLVISLLAALTPPISFDSLLYHLTGPKLHLQEQRIFAFDELHFYFPSLVEMLFLVAMLFKGEIAAQILHFFFGLLLAAALLLFARSQLSPRVGWWSLGLVWSMPLVPLILGWAYVDLALAFYEFLAFWAVVKWLDTQDRRFLLLAGVNSGWAMGVKYTSFVLPLVLALILIYHARRHLAWEFSKILRSVVYFGVVAGVVASPWYLRNLYLVGNPVYPFVFGGRFWDEWLAHWFEQPGSGLGLAWGRLLALPLTATLGIQDESFFDGRIGPLFLALLPVLLISKMQALPEDETKKNRLINYLLLIFIAQFALWALGVIHSQSLFQGRLLLPGLIFLSPALAYSLERIGSFAHRLFSPQRFLTITLAVVLVLGLVTQTVEFMAHVPLTYLVGWESQEEYLERNLREHYLAIFVINLQLPENSIVQFLWEPRTFYCQVDCRPDPILGIFKHLVYLHPSAGAVAQELRGQGITHLLVAEWGRNLLQQTPRLALTAGEAEIWEELVAEHFQQIYADETRKYILYALR